jgi:hypothetical protein
MLRSNQKQVLFNQQKSLFQSLSKFPVLHFSLLSGEYDLEQFSRKFGV